jgi:hypothetical protein
VAAGSVPYPRRPDCHCLVTEHENSEQKIPCEKSIVSPSTRVTFRVAPSLTGDRIWTS